MADFTSQEFGYVGHSERFMAPKTGVYKLEAWGAGGGGEFIRPGGKGGYSVGYVVLNEAQTIYVTVGQGGKGGQNELNVSVFNGGGAGGPDPNITYRGAGGGGATHFAKMSGELKDVLAVGDDQVYIVAGGGGGAAVYAISFTEVDVYKGGDGGGLEGTAGEPGWDDMLKVYFHSEPGTQTSGYMKGQGQAGTNPLDLCGGGGGGYWGGTCNDQSQKCGPGGGGGSGYIGGAPTLTFGDTVLAPETTTGGGMETAVDGKAKITYQQDIPAEFLPVVFDSQRVKKIYVDQDHLVEHLYFRDATNNVQVY